MYKNIIKHNNKFLKENEIKIEEIFFKKIILKYKININN